MTDTRIYTRTDIRNAYEAVGVATGMTVLAHSDLRPLNTFEEPGRNALLSAHYDALRDLVGPKGTIVVPAGNAKLCNTDIPFDPETTPNYHLGVFSEYVRQLPGAQRRFHPFISYAAIGPMAKEITAETSRHGWGIATPKARMIEMDVLSLSIGIIPRLSCSTVHQAEQIVGVPYRYTKEFIHPVKRGDKIIKEPFYLFVTNRDCDIEYDYNQKIWAHFEEHHEAKFAPLGRNGVWSYSLADFYNATVDAMLQDIYIWLKRPPENRPYRK